MDKRIIDFINEHHVLTLATSVNGQPYCANAFYAYDEESNVFVFTSDTSTRHGAEMEQNHSVAASIVLETKNVGRVQGLQITGNVKMSSDKKMRSCYVKRFPYAALADLTIWIIEPVFMKYTDNTLGFGKKLIWNVE